MTAVATTETERLRAQIEETRAEMSDTIDAIQERVRPGRLIADARRYAVPFALVTLGAVLVLIQGLRRRARA
jgi:hypothetical protein